MGSVTSPSTPSSIKDPGKGFQLPVGCADGTAPGEQVHPTARSSGLNVTSAHPVTILSPPLSRHLKELSGASQGLSAPCSAPMTLPLIFQLKDELIRFALSPRCLARQQSAGVGIRFPTNRPCRTTASAKSWRAPDSLQMSPPCSDATELRVSCRPPVTGGTGGGQVPDPQQPWVAADGPAVLMDTSCTASAGDDHSGQR